MKRIVKVKGTLATYPLMTTFAGSCTLVGKRFMYISVVLYLHMRVLSLNVDGFSDFFAIVFVIVLSGF